MKQLTIVLIAGMLTMLCTAAVSADSNLTIPEAKFDFGIVPQHSSISHSFTLQSTGTDTLHITSVKPGCGCTKAPLTKKYLAPGESTELEVIFSTKVYRGKQSKRPRISINEGAPKYVMFTADVFTDPDKTQPIVISPYKFDISQYGVEKRTKLEFSISNVGEIPLSPKLIDIPEGMFKVDLPDKIEPGKTAKGKIELLPEYVTEEFEKSMTIELNDPSSTRFTIPIKRTVRTLSSRTGE